MAVQFILGRSGTGKTSFCIKAIVNALLVRGNERPLILLVPEQATYQAERAILSDKRIGGYSRLNVLSFDRLQFLLTGKNTVRPALSRIGREMVIQRILRDSTDKLKVLRFSAAQPGLGRQIADTVAELHRYARTPDDIDELLGKLQKDNRNSFTAFKFADVNLILREYLKFVEGRFIDPDVQLTGARLAVADSAITAGAKLWVDGFSGFNTGELVILAELLKTAADAQIALCLDPARIDLKNPDIAAADPADLFYPTQRTYIELLDVIKKCKLKLAEPIILKKPLRFSSSQQLAHVERNIFEQRPVKISAADGVRIVSAPNARAEVRFVAGQIARLVREQGFRYRDIAVIASDIEYYQHYIKAYFDDHRLPFFIDRQKPLSRHPIVQLICSALAAAGDDFSGSDIFSYLKTGLVPVENDDIDLLENYCIAFGISGSDWQSDQQWHFAGPKDTEFDEQRINRTRLKVAGPLLKLRDDLCCRDAEGTINVIKFTAAVFDFLDGLTVREKIGQWIEEAHEAGAGAADEHRQFYNRFVDVFDELVEIFGSQELNCKAYIAIVRSAFSQLKLGFIPPTLDQVLVGSIERSRHPDLKAVFLIGTTQKQFPVPIGYDGFLTDDDRIAAESAGFQLAATMDKTLAERQYLAYIAFTRASQFLYITYPLADDKGGPAARSPFINNLESLFENLGEEFIAGGQGRIEDVHSETELADLLCSNLGRDAPQSGTADGQGNELLSVICDDEQLAATGAIVRSAINYDNVAKLDADVVRKLFGGKIKSSSSRLSTFAACSYRYFVKYTLGLKERKEFRFEPLDVGNFYHSILDALLKKLNAEKEDFTAIDNEKLLRFLEEEISEFVLTDTFVSNFCRHSVRNEFIIDSAGEVLRDCASAIAEMVRAGGFRPKLSEVSFGEVKESREKIGEYKLTLPDGRLLFLNGKIDRLDAVDINGRKVAVVFDYKKKEKSYDWSEFYNGLDMQLPIYMLAVRTGGAEYENVVGAFYMPVEVRPGGTYKAKGIFNGEFYQQLDSTVKSKNSRFYNFQVSKENGQYGDYGRSGALKPDDFEKVLEFAGRKIKKLAEEIVSGKINVHPYRLGTKSPCSNCEYKSVCRFDWQINDYNPLESLNKPKALGKIDGGKKD